MVLPRHLHLAVLDLQEDRHLHQVQDLQEDHHFHLEWVCLHRQDLEPLLPKENKNTNHQYLSNRFLGKL